MKKINFDFSRLFENSKFLKICSVIVAVAAWFAVTTLVSNDAVSTIKDVSISTDLTGTAAETNGLSIVSLSDETVDVRITGKSYQIGLLEKEDFQAKLDLSEVTQPGRYELDVQVEMPDNSNNVEYEISRVKPEKVTVEFDRLVDSTLTPEAYVPNATAPAGCFLEQAMVSPSEIPISGPESVIQKIKTVRVVNEDKVELKTSQSLDGTLQLLDENGHEIDMSQLTVQTEGYKITVPVYKQVEVPLTFDYINVPDGIDISKISYEMSQEKLVIGVPVDAAADVKSISLGEIDFRKIDVGSIFNFDVSLLAGYINIDGVDEVTVSFPSEGMDYAKISCDNIVLKNVPAKYDVKLLTTKLSGIKFVGEASVVEKLSPSDVVATVDFSNVSLSAGEKRVPVRITLSGEQQAWAVGVDYSVLVRISAKDS